MFEELWNTKNYIPVLLWRVDLGWIVKAITEERAQQLIKEPWPNSTVSIEYSYDGNTWIKVENTSGYANYK